MSDYDLLVAMGEQTINGLLADLFGRQGIRERLFRGDLRVANGGSFTWSVEAAPELALSHPSEEQWKSAIGPDGKRPRPVPGAFTARLRDLRVSGGGLDGASRDAALLCTLGTSGDALHLTPIAASVDLSGVDDPNDRAIYRHIVLPKALQTGLTLLGAIAMPHITVAGVSFDGFAFAVGSGVVVGTANIVGKPAASPTDPARLGGIDFEVRISPTAVEQAADAELNSIRGRWESTSGSAGFGIGRAEYSGGIKLDSGRVTADPENPLKVTAALDIEARGQAGVDLFSEIGEALKKAGEAVGRALNSY